MVKNSTTPVPSKASHQPKARAPLFKAIGLRQCENCGSAVVQIYDDTGQVFAEAHLEPEWLDEIADELHSYATDLDNATDFDPKAEQLKDIPINTETLH
jgi:hypothetical protein